MIEQTIERLILRCVQVPLITPYTLAFGPLRAFDMVLVEVRTDTGQCGWGEATVLTGYTEETIADAWQTATEIADNMVGACTSNLKSKAFGFHGHAPFTASAFVSAVEMAENHAVLTADHDRRVPVLAIINSTDFDALADEIEERLADGYQTLKIKAGFECSNDMKRLEFIQDQVGGRALLRVDANQGYSQADAVKFISGIEREGIELVEQTCAAGDWGAAVAVAECARQSGVPIMLDESIFCLEDVDRAAELHCADIIKLKLMKMGGLDALIGGLGHIAAKGMGRVLGNGVAGDIGCWMEACVAADMIANAGEMNGFLKPKHRLFGLPMRLDRGDLVLMTGNRIETDHDALDYHTRERSDVLRGNLR